MSWTISHGTPGGRSGDCHVRTGTQVGDWRDAMNSMPLSARDRSVVEPLTRRRSGAPFSIRPRQAAAAERAAAAGEPWRWS
jgi:hypothetical protein